MSSTQNLKNRLEKLEAVSVAAIIPPANETAEQAYFRMINEVTPPHKPDPNAKRLSPDEAYVWMITGKMPEVVDNG